MNQEYFDRLSKFAKGAQGPFQEFAELNVKTLQELRYPKPEEFSSIKKPEEFIEQQVATFISNGHKMLDYMQKSFQIMEKSMLSIVKEAKNKSPLATSAATKGK